MSQSTLYLRFLSLLHGLEGDSSAAALDLDAKKILEVVTVAHAKGQPLTVSEAMNMTQIASPATIHRKLDLLREHGMIDLQHDGHNRRTKFVLPTARTLEYFGKIEQALRSAFHQA